MASFKIQNPSVSLRRACAHTGTPKGNLGETSPTGKVKQAPTNKAPREKPLMKIAALKVQEKVQWAGQAIPNHPEDAPKESNLRSSPTQGGFLSIQAVDIRG